MQKYNNILVIVEAQQEKQVALERAIEIANYSDNVKITAFLSIYDFSYDVTSVLTIEEQEEIKESVLNTNIDWLSNILNKYENDKITIETKIVWQRNQAEAILKEVVESNCDLLIKGVEQHGILDTLLFTPLDWQLLRHSQIPVLIAKDHPWEENQNIIVSIGLTGYNSEESYDNDKLVNNDIIRTAQELAILTKGNIHLVHAVAPITPLPILDVPNISNEIFSDAILKDRENIILKIADKYRIPYENCHIEKGLPDEIIPAIANELKAQAVLISNVARTGISGAVIGNTCELIVDELNCDLMVFRKK